MGRRKRNKVYMTEKSIKLSCVHKCSISQCWLVMIPTLAFQGGHFAFSLQGSDLVSKR
jgi:hypothetical protein